MCYTGSAIAEPKVFAAIYVNWQVVFAALIYAGSASLHLHVPMSIVHFPRIAVFPFVLVLPFGVSYFSFSRIEQNFQSISIA